MSRDACTICDSVMDADDLWRIVRRPDDPIEWVEHKTWSETRRYQTSGPEHQAICPDCWSKATGFLDRLREWRQEKRV